MIPFEKWEGLGNDFVLVNERDLPHVLTVEEVVRLCDRRRGIGADGVLVVGANPPSMIVRNADGSRSEMCGNGLRCVCGFLLGTGGGMSMAVQTDAGDLGCDIERASDDEVIVEVAMGRATSVGTLVDEGGRAFAQVDIGNPHAISFEPFEASTVDEIGPRLSRVPSRGTNVEFVRQHGESFEVVVWERGVGRTEACGTGACAVAFEACRIERASFERPIEVRLPGGALTITVSRSGDVRMRGPARRVFRGTLSL